MIDRPTRRQVCTIVPEAIAARGYMKTNQVEFASDTIPKLFRERRLSNRAGIRFVSQICSSQRPSLEQLLYFNARQSRVSSGIELAIETYGAPEIVETQGQLRILVPGLLSAQSLFALEASTGRPIGVAVFARPDIEHMVIVHLGIAAEFAAGGFRADEQLLLKMVRELHRCSQRIKGVTSLSCLYTADRHRAASVPTLSKMFGASL